MCTSLYPQPAVLKQRDISELQQQHHQRQTTLKNACVHYHPPADHTDSLPGDRQRFFSFSERHHLVYCSIQKVGTSFWLRVMKLLNGNISRSKFFRDSFSHSTGIRGYYSFTSKSPWMIERILRSYKTFLFVRDPYSRLFSAYMDKIFLPNSRAVTLVRRSGLKNADGEKVLGKCFLHVTFEAFLQEVTNGDWRDSHWSPMHEHCGPCSVRFDYIGKMETFMADTEFILSQIGANLYSLTPEANHFESAKDLRYLTDLAGEIFDKVKQRDCPSETYHCQVIQKIWIVLQTRGLLSKHIPYPFPRKNCKVFNKLDFLQRLVELYHRQPGTRAQRMSQRKEALMEAYSALPRQLLLKVERYVAVDCEMFGYDCSVDSRFPLNNSGLFWKRPEYFTQFR
ncbi:hypothetical protein ACOMHN_053460 [Nucella lapillus]